MVSIRQQVRSAAASSEIRRWCLVGVAGLWLAAMGSACRAAEAERSFWLHASLGLFTQRGYFGPAYPETAPPLREQVRNAARLLTQGHAVNRLYLICHREMPLDACRQVFLWWRQACPPDVEIVPALVLRMYDAGMSPVFTADELSALVEFFRREINRDHVAVYDIASHRDAGPALAQLVRAWPDGVIRLGLQPDEAPEAPFASAVQDTWSGLCHGKDNERDWAQPGFGADTLRKWVLARNGGTRPVTWDLVAVAWDYTATERGGYPGYDDAAKNMPLPAGRNAAALKVIRDAADAASLGGFSSDLYILHENSRSAPHDGRDGSFYECLKRGEDYRGYYGAPFQEIVQIFRTMHDKEKTK